MTPKLVNRCLLDLLLNEQANSCSSSVLTLIQDKEEEEELLFSIVVFNNLCVVDCGLLFHLISLMVTIYLALKTYRPDQENW